MARLGWKDVSNTSYATELLKSRLFWLGKCFDPNLGIQVGEKRFPLSQILLVNEIKTRECMLKSCNDWKAFIDTCYTLGCKNCGESGKDGWTAIGGKKLKFYEWLNRENARKNTDEYFRYDNTEFKKNNTILTVYDERKRNRLLVDGLHRSVALTVECEEGRSVSAVKILECYGKHANAIFPFDIHQLPGKWSFLNFRVS